GRQDASPYDLVRETWRPQGGKDFESWWTGALQDGVIAGSVAPVIAPGAAKLPDVPKAAAPANTITLILGPDPSLWDGTYANNAWLQECPKPLTKQVWGNALAL